MERRKLFEEKRLRSQLHLPLFTSPLEEIPAGIRKVRTHDAEINFRVWFRKDDR